MTLAPGTETRKRIETYPDCPAIEEEAMSHLGSPEGMNIATFLTFGGCVPGDYLRPGEPN